MDDKNLKYKIESETLRRLIKHLQENNELQNIFTTIKFFTIMKGMKIYL